MSITLKPFYDPTKPNSSSFAKNAEGVNPGVGHIVESNPRHIGE